MGTVEFTYLFLGTLFKHFPELGGVRDPGVGRLGGGEEGVVLVVEAEELDVRLGALGHPDRTLVQPRLEVGNLTVQPLCLSSNIPAKNRRHHYLMRTLKRFPRKAPFLSPKNSTNGSTNSLLCRVNHCTKVFRLWHE